ncbi:hypothetical protein MMC10_011160 [Thelotrema lepadinum]|nr:hypothetical protein [Thelotrema lepadinum]
MAPAPTGWSSFIYPPQSSALPVLTFNTQDAVNVSWTTPSTNTEFFDTLELILWWTAPLNGPSQVIVNETVPLSGSRVFSTGYGGTFPAVAWFALFYRQVDGTIVNGPASLGFNVSNANPSVKGRLWSQDPADIPLSNPSAPSSTAAQGSSPTQANSTTIPSDSPTENGLSAGLLLDSLLALLQQYASCFWPLFSQCIGGTEDKSKQLCNIFHTIT